MFPRRLLTPANQLFEACVQVPPWSVRKHAWGKPPFNNNPADGAIRIEIPSRAPIPGAVQIVSYVVDAPADVRANTEDAVDVVGAVGADTLPRNHGARLR